jgi:hypothetical protein
MLVPGQTVRMLGVFAMTFQAECQRCMTFKSCETLRRNGISIRLCFTCYRDIDDKMRADTHFFSRLTETSSCNEVPTHRQHTWKLVPAESGPKFWRYKCPHPGCNVWGYKRHTSPHIYIYLSKYVPKNPTQDITAQSTKRPEPVDEYEEKANEVEQCFIR